MSTKLDKFQQDISTFSTDYDVIIVTETWLKEDIHIFRKDRKLSKHVTRGGGILVAVKKSLGCYKCSFGLDIDDDLDQIFMYVYKDQKK